MKKMALLPKKLTPAPVATDQLGVPRAPARRRKPVLPPMQSYPDTPKGIALSMEDILEAEEPQRRTQLPTREKPVKDRDWISILLLAVVGLVAGATIFLGAVLTLLPWTSNNMVWVHAENAFLAVLLVLVYIKKR